jgi:SAM-dependent methyltransferase
MSAVFDAYGRYYDLLYADKDYSAEADWVRARVDSHHPKARTVLELGCGTGAHAVALARKGLKVHGIDRSEAMLDAARRRVDALPEGLGRQITFSAGDIRSLRTGASYDVVLSLFHVFSYLTTNQDLKQGFATAAAHLAPGGLLVFDFWFGPAVLSLRPETRVRRLGDSTCRITRIAEPEHHWSDNVVDVRYSMFVEQRATGSIQQLNENHRMRYLFIPELEELAAAWFTPLEWRAWLCDSPPAPDQWAACAVMQRK